jgi:hypothetical protein
VVARPTALEDGGGEITTNLDHNGGRTMHTLNERLDETESVQVQEVSAGDTPLNWSLEDFSDIVPKSTPGEERDVTEIPDEFVH